MAANVVVKTEAGVEDEEFEKLKNGDEKRDESKSKKIMALLDKGQLPESILAAWEASKK